LVSSIAGIVGELFVGGSFTTAGGRASINLAVWHIPHSLSIGQASGQVHLRWPATGSSFVLEANQDASGADRIHPAAVGRTARGSKAGQGGRPVLKPIVMGRSS
jgi:hypothetical protein